LCRPKNSVATAVKGDSQLNRWVFNWTTANA
jgi:hypothetical protein